MANLPNLPAQTDGINRQERLKELLSTNTSKTLNEHILTNYCAELISVLKNVIDGNDLALERKQPMDSWSDSYFRNRAIIVLDKGRLNE